MYRGKVACFFSNDGIDHHRSMYISLSCGKGTSFSQRPAAGGGKQVSSPVVCILYFTYMSYFAGWSVGILIMVYEIIPI